MPKLFTPRCRYCQSDIKDTDKVCPHCGEKIPEDESPIGIRTARAYKRGMSYAGGKPLPEKKFSEHEKKKSCFIATAAYGTPMAYEIDLIRNWKKHFLLKRRGGRKFVTTYYRVSPPVAKIISKSKFLRSLVRFGLYPLILHLKKGN